MNVFEFAQAFLYPYKIYGDEIRPTYCPICKGGEHQDKGTFALNTQKLTYNCLRGSCSASGTFRQLCDLFRVEADKNNYFEVRKPRKAYKKPQTVLKTLTNKAEEYLKKRKISTGTMKVFNIGCDENGNIIFPFYNQENVLEFVKFRPSRKVEKGERKAWREEGTKPILYGMNLCNFDEPLIICEGEIDCLSLFESGIQNAVSVPSGTNDLDWIENCWDWLERFSRIILFGDNDDPGRDMITQTIKRLGEWRCMIIPEQYYNGCKDANEILYKYGSENIIKAIENAKDLPICGLVNLADVLPVDIKNIPRVSSGIQWLDNAIGGFLMGEVSVWTGKRGEGKSTLFSQLIVDCIDQDEPVCVYSGELRADRFQYWINLQAAGQKFIKKYFDAFRNKEVCYVPQDINTKIKAWYNGKIWLYDNNISTSSAEESSILKLFEYAYKKYGCRVFFIDNLMTANYKGKNEKDFWRAQGNFVGELVNFTNRYNVHVHLAAHPRKNNGSDLGNDDIAGTSEITDRAHNVFAVKRIDRNSPEETQNVDLKLGILKNRSEGAHAKIGLNFCPISRRIYLPSVGPDKRYEWEDFGKSDQELEAEYMRENEY